MTEITRRYVYPLPKDIGDGPFLSAPPDGDAPPPVSRLETKVFRHAPYDNEWLFGRSAFVHTGMIEVDDTIAPGEFKRVTQHLPIHGDPAEFQGVRMVFEGTDPSPYSIDMLGGGPPGRGGAIADVIGILDNTAKHGTPMPPLDQMYNLELRRLKCEQDDMCFFDDGQRDHQFMFNNGARVIFDYACNLGRSALISFDVFNHNPVSPAIVRFRMKLLQVRIPEGKARSAPSSQGRNLPRSRRP